MIEYHEKVNGTEESESIKEASIISPIMGILWPRRIINQVTIEKKMNIQSLFLGFKEIA